jgi:hypothetical protein
MIAMRGLARRVLRHLDRFAAATNDVLFVFAIGLGGFYLSVQVILALASPPPADDPGRFSQSAIAGAADAGNAGFPYRAN